MMYNTLSAITSQCMMRANLVSVITVEPRFSGPLGGKVNWATGKLKIVYLIPSAFLASLKSNLGLHSLVRSLGKPDGVGKQNIF